MLGLHRQSPRSTAAMVSAKVSKAVFLFFFLQPAESRSHPTRRREEKKKKGREGSFMVTKLFIKSPVPGIDGEWGR